MRPSSPSSSRSCGVVTASAATDAQRHAHQVPRHAARGRAAVGLEKRALGGRRVRVPAGDGLVVVRPGVDDAVAHVVVGQERVRRVAERELQDAHPRQREAIAQREHVGRDLAQVLGDERQAAEPALERGEERLPGPRHPAPGFGGERVAGHLPVAGEAAEVIQPHEVDQAQHGLHARDPPRVALGGVRLPAIERVAPQLARLREVVRRHAGDHGRPARGVELEQLAVRPHVGAVVGDEDRRIADERDAARIGRARAAPSTGGRTPTGGTPRDRSRPRARRARRRAHPGARRAAGPASRSTARRRARA